jgi:hypothetical protein
VRGILRGHRPAGQRNAGVTVTTRAGSSATSPPDHSSYVPAAPAPKVTKLSPHEGPEGSGTTVAVSGKGFQLP